jgi:hypothetical protein
MGGTAATSRTSSSRSAMMAAAMQQLHCTLLHCGSYRAAAFLPAGMAEGSSSQWLPCHAIRAMPATRARIACAAIRYESQDPRTQQLQAVDLDRPVPACSDR